MGRVYGIARSLRISCLCLVSLSIGCATAAPLRLEARGPAGGDAASLPLVRVRLYANGVGYFERKGDVGAEQNRIPVPASHLDDMLKSLVVLSARSDALSLDFPTRMSPRITRARAGITAPENAAPENAAQSYDGLLAALRGERVVVTLHSNARFGATQLSGRLMEVLSVDPSAIASDSEFPRLQVVLLSPKHGIIRLDVGEIVAVRPSEPRVMERFEAALAAPTALRGNPTTWLTLTHRDRAIHALHLGYLAETPLWRPSYRIMLPDGGRAELQAWALVHNDTDEEWQQVALELVDGSPRSFLFPGAAPRYARRELNTPDPELSSVPQLATTTPDALWGDFSDYQGEVVGSISQPDAFGAGGLGLSGIGEGGGGRGEGIGLGTIGTLGHGSARSWLESDLLWIGDLERQAGVVPAANRAVSRYEVSSPVHILPQHSALIPFLTTPVSATSIVWFSRPGAAPERAIRLTNDTPNSLPEGPVAVFGRGGLLGEALLRSLKPGARQFARIGAVSDFDLAASDLEASLVRQHLDFQSESLRVHSVASAKPKLVFNNRSGAPAEVYVGIPVVMNSTIEGADGLDFDSTTRTPFAVFELPVGPGTVRDLTTRQGVVETKPVQELEPSDLDELVSDAALPMDERAVLSNARPLLEQGLATRRALAELEDTLSAAREELEGLERTSEDVGSAESEEAGTTLTTRVLRSLDEIRKLEDRKRALAREARRERNDLSTMLAELNVLRAKVLSERRRTGGD